MPPKLLSARILAGMCLCLGLCVGLVWPLASAALTLSPELSTESTLLSQGTTQAAQILLQAKIPDTPSRAAAQASQFIAAMMAQAATVHPSVKAKLADLQGSKASVNAAQWQYYPTPSVLTERGANQTHKTGLTSTTTLRVQQPLWSGGRLQAGVRQAELKQLAATGSVREAQWSVALRTLDAWQAMVTAFGRDQATRQALAQLEGFEQMMQRRVQQQVSAVVDGELVQARVLQARADVVGSTAALDAARQRLVQWVIDWDQFVVTPDLLRSALASSAAQAPLANPSLQARERQQLLQAVEQYPSLVRFEAEIGAAQQELAQKEAERWPSVFARMDRQFSDYPASATRLSDTTVYVGLQMSLGAGLSLQSAIQTSQSRVQSLLAERETQRREIEERFESEWREYVSVVQRMEASTKVLQSNEALLQSYTRLFVAGRRTWLELLNAVRELAQAQTALSDLQAQQHAAHFRLKLYRGELDWQLHD